MPTFCRSESLLQAVVSPISTRPEFACKSRPPLIQVHAPAELGAAACHGGDRQIPATCTFFPAVHSEPSGCYTDRPTRDGIGQPMCVGVQACIGRGGCHSVSQDAPNPAVVVASGFGEHGTYGKRGRGMK